MPVRAKGSRPRPRLRRASPRIRASTRSTRSAGATPSTPTTGELVASAWRPNVGVSYLYADGRLIWLDEVNGTPGFVEQRLTPAGVERVRSEFLASGLFDPGRGFLGQEPREYVPQTLGPGGCLVCVRDGGRLLERGVRDLTQEEDLLVDHLATLPASLPPTDWADQQITTYVPSKYAVCLVGALTRGRQSARPVPSQALKALPPRAAKLLRGRQATRGISVGEGTCFEVTTANARVLANELVDEFGAPAPAVVDQFDTKYTFQIDADVNRAHLKRLGIAFWQLLPDGARASYYPAKH